MGSYRSWSLSFEISIVPILFGWSTLRFWYARMPSKECTDSHWPQGLLFAPSPPPSRSAMLVTDEHFQSAQVIWDYLHLDHKPIPAEVIVALGTNDLRVAEFAADLYFKGFGKRILCTGGTAHQGDLLATSWDRPEAEMYAEVIESRGVPCEHLILETRALNTAENIRFSRDLLEQLGLVPKNIVLAVKPFMQRRTWAHLTVEWPEMPATVTSPSMSLEDYFTSELTPAKVLNIMMGDLQRVWIYGRRGWSAPQRVPQGVLAAFERLKAAGFTQHLIEDGE
jgi:uncharacterized SAM-binding protein YcdF (DUF218 family)